MMRCPECDAEERLIVDGLWTTEESLLQRNVAPRRIERRVAHARWCTRLRATFADPEG